MSHCPVCELPVDEQATACPQCGWEFPFFLNITPAEEQQYRAALAQARTAWQQQTLAEPLVNTDTVSPAPPSVDSTDANTPTLQAQPDESAAEFGQRLNENGPYHAGTAILLTEHYDSQRQSLPLMVTWDEWLPLSLNGLYIRVDPDFVQQLPAHANFSISAQLGADEQGAVIVRGLSLQTEGQSIGIKQFEDEQYWAWVSESKSIAAYQQYLASHTLKNHHQSARTELQSLSKQQQQQDSLVLISGFLLAGLGTAIGAGLSVQWFESFALVMSGGFVGACVLTGSAFLFYMAVTTLSVHPESTLFAIDSVNGKQVVNSHVKINRQQTPQIHLRGWAIDKIAKKPAGGVILKIGRQSLTALYGRERPDLVRSLRSEHYRYAGFSLSFDSQLLPVGEYYLLPRILTHDRKRYYLPEHSLKVLVE